MTEEPAGAHHLTGGRGDVYQIGGHALCCVGVGGGVDGCGLCGLCVLIGVHDVLSLV